MAASSPPYKYYLTRSLAMGAYRPYRGRNFRRIYGDAWRRKDSRHRERDDKDREFDAFLLGRREDSGLEEKRSRSSERLWIRRLTREQTEFRKRLSSSSILRESCRSSRQLSPPRNQSIHFSLVPVRQTPAHGSHTPPHKSRSPLPPPVPGFSPSFLSQSPSPLPRTPILSTPPSSLDVTPKRTSSPKLQSFSFLKHQPRTDEPPLPHAESSSTSSLSPYQSERQTRVRSSHTPSHKSRSPLPLPVPDVPPSFLNQSLFTPPHTPILSTPCPYPDVPPKRTPTPKLRSLSYLKHRPPTDEPPLLWSRSKSIPSSIPRRSPSSRSKRPISNRSKQFTRSVSRSYPSFSRYPRYSGSKRLPPTCPKPPSASRSETPLFSSTEPYNSIPRQPSSFHSKQFPFSAPSDQAAPSREDLLATQSPRRSTHQQSRPDVPLVPLSPLRPYRSPSPASPLRRMLVTVEVH